MQVNLLGREYNSEKPVGEDLGYLLVNDVRENGGDKSTGYVPRGVIQRTAEKFKFSRYSVRRIWNRYVQNGTCVAVKKQAGDMGNFQKMTLRTWKV